MEVLDLIQKRLDCGSVRENHQPSQRDHTFVLVVRRRRELLDKVIPFFEANPLLSCKQQELSTFADIVRRMAVGEHLTDEGFERLAARATLMNGGGKYRRIYRNSTSGILRDHMPSTVSYDGEDMVRSAWRHAESDRNALTLDASSSR